MTNALEIYSGLAEQANKIANIGNLNWNSPVCLLNKETGESFEIGSFAIIDKSLIFTFSKEKNT